MFGSRRSSDRLRREAAERALLGDRSPSSDPELDRELAAMHRLVRDLDALPGRAWSEIPARPPRRGRSTRTTVRVRLGTVALVACLACLACLAGGFVIGHSIGHGSPSGRPPVRSSGQTVALRPLTDGQSGSAFATMPAPGRMILRVRSLPASAPGTYYELWLMTNLHHLTPVASFRVGSSMHTRLSLVLPDDPSRYAYLDISLQSVNSGTAHSGDSVLRGATD